MIFINIIYCKHLVFFLLININFLFFIPFILTLGDKEDKIAKVTVTPPTVNINMMRGYHKELLIKLIIKAAKEVLINIKKHASMASKA